MANIDKAQEVHEERIRSHSPEAEKLEVDTVRNDEALKIITAYGGLPTWEPLEEKKLRRKIDKRLLPILCITYALQYYDKGMSRRILCSVIHDGVYFPVTLWQQ